MKHASLLRYIAVLAYAAVALAGCAAAPHVPSATATTPTAPSAAAATTTTTDEGGAELTAMYDHYREGELDAAISTAENFLSRHPNHPRADYATYVIAISQLARALHLLDDPARSGQAMEPLRAAFQQFGSLQEHHPQSDYAKPARERQIYARQLMAHQELVEAKAHLSAGDTFGARAQATYVLENYADTPSATEAHTVIAMADTLDQGPLASKKQPAAPEITPNLPPSATPTLPAPKTPSSTKIASTLAGIKINDESWLLAQDPSYYTVQLMATKDTSTHLAYVTRYNLRGAANYYGGEGRGYRLVHGVYPSHEAAEMAAKHIAKTLGLSATWIRSFADIQSDIRSRQHPVDPPPPVPAGEPAGDAP